MYAEIVSGKGKKLQIVPLNVRQRTVQTHDVSIHCCIVNLLIDITIVPLLVQVRIIPFIVKVCFIKIWTPPFFCIPHVERCVYRG